MMAHKRSRQAYEADVQKAESPYVQYGTPLPPIDDHSRDDGSYVPVWKQEVTDDRGRKRLHGAFTGGFSAGYFNTVGSKEGWSPASFVSSRTNRAKDQKRATEKQQQQRIEDFMDEEDIREAEESRRLSTNADFTGFGTEDDPSRRGALSDLFRSNNDSIGFKLLNKMGWKEGQGIGPKIKRHAAGDDNDLSDKYTFAPADVPMVSMENNVNSRGLGYAGQNDVKPSNTTGSTIRRRSFTPSDEEEGLRARLDFAPSSKKASKAKLTSMGVGVLNDTGSDDEDPYSMGPKISYNRTLGGDKKSKKKQQHEQKAPLTGGNPLLKSKPLFTSKKLSSMQNALRKCNDGRLPLSGFVLADELDSFPYLSLHEDKYKPPSVPDGWMPAQHVSNPTPSQEQEQVPQYQSTAEAAKQSSLTSSSRSVLLGETVLPGKSVFDYLTPAARDRLAKTSGKTNLPPALSEKLAGTDVASGRSPSDNQNQKSLLDLIPHLDQSTAALALSRAQDHDSGAGFVPYAEDLSKRARYQIFLRYSAGTLPEGETPVYPDQMTIEDWTNEMSEFVRAAEVFRPVSGGLSSRFTSSSGSVLDPASENAAGARDGENLVRRPTQKPEDPADTAAKLGMFGLMTRIVVSFTPNKLVCKRFGVDVPDPSWISSMTASSTFGASNVHVSRDQDNNRKIPANYNSSSITGPIPQTGSSRNFHGAGYVIDRQENILKPTIPTSSSGVAASAEKQVGIAAPAQPPQTAAVDPDRNDALEAERPGAAVFRAIFGDDSDSD